MSIAVRIRRGQGPFWSLVKWLALKLLGFHLPVVPATKPLFGFLYGCHVAVREATLWALRFFWFEPLFRSQCAAVGKGFRLEHLPYLTGKGRIVVGDQVFPAGKSGITFSNQIHAAPELRIGDDTFVGHACSISVADSVVIGKHCLIASGVRIADFDGHPVDAARRRAKEPTPAEAIRPIVIGNDVWVGQDSIILKGVTVGDRSIIGARAVVTRDVPPDVVVGGNPARVLKHLADRSPESANGHVPRGSST